jgi:TonB-dependent starch-binding outer membrane protein SusC
MIEKLTNGMKRITEIHYLKLSLLLLGLLFTTGTLFAQVRTIAGVVKDASGAGLPGVSVIIKGTSTGTATNAEGEFQLNVPGPETILIFSSIGTISQEIKVENRNKIEVVLQADVSNLEGVVVIGYGTIKKKDLTGAVSVVSTKDIQNRVNYSVGSVLKGMSSGVTVTTTGQPGTGAVVRIRGLGSLSNNDPLFVVDGLNLVGASNINAQDIESIQILKDASAAAIYGARAANGVIIITTKKGKEGPMKVDFTSNVSYNWLPKYDLMDATEYKKWDDVAYTNAIAQGVAGVTKLQNHYDSNTNWQDEIVKSSIIQNYNLALSGGTKTLNTYVSGNFMRDQGNVFGTDYTKYSFRVNTSGEKGIISYGENLYFTNEVTNGMWNNPFANLISMPPTIPIYDGTHSGGYGYGSPDRANTYALNPIAGQNLVTSKNKGFFANGNIYGQVKLFDALTYKMNFLFVGYTGTTDGMRKIGNWTMGQGADKANLSRSTRIQQKYNFENTVNFKKVIKKHDIDAMAGILYEVDNIADQSSTKLDPTITSDGVYLSSMNVATGLATVGTVFSKGALISYIGRLNYSYDDRYLLSATIRDDGSSRLTPANRWAYFPSVALGWRISKEKFYNVKWMNELKLRASYGQLGNANIGYWDYLNFINTNPRALFGNPAAIAIGSTVSKLSNTNLKWERKIQTDIGIDASFLNNRLTFTADYFISKTNDILTSMPLLLTTGSATGNYGPNTSITVNAASLENRGFEFNVGWVDKVGELSYSAKLNFTKLTNKITELGFKRTEQYTNLAVSRVGQPLAMFYLLKTDGLFQSDIEVQAYKNSKGIVIQPTAKPGDIRFVDSDDNGQINTNDRQVLGNPWPKFESGIELGASWRNFDMMINGHGRFDFDIWNGSAQTAGTFANNNNNFRNFNPWSSTNTNTRTPRALYGDTRNSIGNMDFWLENGTFFRFDEIGVGYTLPAAITKKIHFRNLRAGLTMQNLLTFTGYTGLDPDFADSGIFDKEQDGAAYPNPRSVLFNLTLGF